MSVIDESGGTTAATPPPASSPGPEFFDATGGMLGDARAPNPRLQTPCENCGRADCPTCAAAASVGMGRPGGLPGTGLLYAVGRIDPVFPNESVEKELAQAIGRAETVDLTDREAVHRILTSREAGYIARQLCWVLSINRVPSFIVLAHDRADVDDLIKTLRPMPRESDVDIVIGTVGPPAQCGGRQLHTVHWAQIYSFDVDDFVGGLERPDGIREDRWQAAVEEVWSKLFQLTDNTGMWDRDRALNYLTTRYTPMIELVARKYAEDFTFQRPVVRPSSVGASAGGQPLIDVILQFRHRKNQTEETWRMIVDVSDVFPFVVRGFSQTYDI